MASLALGLVVGWASRSRWSIAVAPLLFVGVVELVRIDVVGPTVDAISTSTYGVLALVAGRGVHGLLTVFPMALGAGLGAGLARRATGLERSSGWVGRGVAIVAGLALVALVAGLVRPASTAAITGPDGDVLPDSIAELTTVDVDGKDLGLMIRGHDVDNPVLLFLAGGPGGSERGAMRNHLAGLEEHVTVVTWDQRGTGASYDALDPTDTLTVDAAVDDTIAVTDHLRDRFGVDRVLLAGQSWGTTLGVLAVQRAPERYSGFVGSGQMVSQLDTDRIMYADTLAWARDAGRDGPAERQVDAPTKQLTVLATSGHRPPWEQPDAFVDHLVETVLPATAATD